MRNYFLVLHLGIYDKRICLSIFLHAFNSSSSSCLRFNIASLHRTYNRFRNINLIPISFAFRLHLRGRLTLRSLTLLRKPWAYGVQVSRLHYRYSCQHSLLYTLQHTSRYTFNAEYNALLPHLRVRGFGLILSPDHLRCMITRPVSYYALFEWWLLLSQHPGCLCN